MPANHQLISSGSPYEPIVGISRAVRAGNQIWVSGTAPLGPEGITVEPGNPVAQARRCLEIIRQAVEKLGGHLEDIVRTRVFLTRIDDWEYVARVHGEFFRNIRPASTMVEVKRFIDKDWLVEIEADAVLND